MHSKAVGGHDLAVSPPSLTWLWLRLRLLIQRRCVHCRWGRGYVFGGRVRRRVRELRQKIWLEGALRLGLWRRGLELAHAKITHLNISFISFVRDSGTRVYIYIQLLHLAYSAFFFFFFTWKRKLLQAASILKESMTEMTSKWRHSKQLRPRYRFPFRSPWREFSKKVSPDLCFRKRKQAAKSNPAPGTMLEYALKTLSQTWLN